METVWKHIFDVKVKFETISLNQEAQASEEYDFIEDENGNLVLNQEGSNRICPSGKG